VFRRTSRALLCWLLVSAPCGVLAQESMRDPTRPLNYRAQSQTTPLTLNSILIGEDRRLAVINGNHLAERDRIPNTRGITVKRIEAQAVLLEQGDKRWRLSLPVAAESIRTTGTEND